MSRSRTNDDKDSFRNRPAIPISPDELERLVRIADEGTGEELPEELLEKGVVKKDDDLDMADIALINAATHYCGDDKHKLLSMISRVHSLFSILCSREARDWIGFNREMPDLTLSFHPALIDVAATLPLRIGGEFESKEFFRRVRELAATKYSHLNRGEFGTI